MPEQKQFKIAPPATIKTGRKVVFYGPAGRGKTTLAGLAPKPVFLDFEGGARGQGKQCVEGVATFLDLREAVRQAVGYVPEGGTLVIDSMSHVSALIDDYLLVTMGKQKIHQLGYDYFPSHREAMRLLLADLESVYRAGRNIVLIAHENAAIVKNPLAADYTQYAPVLPHANNASSRDEVIRWAEYVWRISYEQPDIEKESATAKTGKVQNPTNTRVIFTSGTEAMVAKSWLINGNKIPPLILFASETDRSAWNCLSATAKVADKPTV